jgi:hypothetical protein
MPQMPYLNCEWSRERRAISEELKKVNEEMKKRKQEEEALLDYFKMLRHTTWATQSEADSTEIASSHPAENDDDEKNETGDHAQPRKGEETKVRTRPVPPQHSDSDTGSESASAASETSSDSEGPDETKTPPESNRRMDRPGRPEAKLRRRLTDDINLISSYLDHKFPLHVSILSN